MHRRWSDLRLGEACALLRRSADLDTGTFAVEASVVRIKGHGLLRRTTKTARVCSSGVSGSG